MNRFFIALVFSSCFLSHKVLANCGPWDQFATKKLQASHCFGSFSLVTRARTPSVMQSRYQLTPTMRFDTEPLVPLWVETVSSEQDSSNLKTRTYDYGPIVPSMLQGNVPTTSIDLAVPISSRLARHIWPTLEQYEQQAAKEKGAITVLNGVITGEDNQVAALYKIIVHQRSNAHIAFMLPNDGTLSDDLRQYVTTVECIEKQVGIDVIKKVDELNGWSRSAAHGLDVWTQGGNPFKGECPSLTAHFDSSLR